MKKYLSYSEEFKQSIVNLYWNGKESSEILSHNRNMAYSKDLRECVIAYLKEGHAQEETGIIFKVGMSTITRWLALLSETGSLEKRMLDRSPWF